MISVLSILDCYGRCFLLLFSFVKYGTLKQDSLEVVGKSFDDGLDVLGQPLDDNVREILDLLQFVPDPQHHVHQLHLLLVPHPVLNLGLGERLQVEKLQLLRYFRVSLEKNKTLRLGFEMYFT